MLGLPEVAAWPEMQRIVEQKVAQRAFPIWRFPLAAYRAVGGDGDAGLVGACATACMHVSVTLVDDLLDEDPRGEHHQSGAGPTANLALAFQAAAFRLVAQAEVDAACQSGVSASLARMALATAYGQQLDAQNLSGEENYWKVVRAKSTPFFGMALHVGALLGGASPEVATALHDAGLLLGEIIQIRDDLADALRTPANPDWQQGRNNLAILYARSADHPDRVRFEDLLPRVADLTALREAQQLLIRCGAVSYCAYHLVQRHRALHQRAARISLPDPLSLLSLLSREAQPLIRLLRSSGVPVSDDILAASAG